MYPSERSGLAQLSSTPTLSAWCTSSLSAHKRDIHVVLTVQGRMAGKGTPVKAPGGLARAWSNCFVSGQMVAVCTG